MKYYRLALVSNAREIGEFPQVSEPIYSVPIKDPSFISNYPLLTKIEGHVNVPAATLSHRAKATDLMSASPIGFNLKLLISEKLKTVLKQYVESRAQLFQTYVLDKTGNKLAYWIMHPYKTDLANIDFENSEIWIRGLGNALLRKVEMKDINEFEVQKDSLTLPEGLVIQTLVLREDVVSDFFILSQVRGGLGYYVSEKLKSEIEDQNCTGISFEEVESVF